MATNSCEGNCTFVREVKQQFSDAFTYTSFSGGKDSTAISNILRSALEEETIKTAPREKDGTRPRPQ